jgi:hypothetical protein
MRVLKLSVVAIGLLALLLSVGLMAQDVKWFDMENCAFCKPVMDQPGLMDNMVWEHVTTVKPEYMDAYKKAMSGIDEVQKKLAAGETVPMCGMCQSMGALMAKGAKVQHIPTMVGSVTLMTSSDAAVVKEIQDWAKKTNDELAKMETSEKMEKEEGQEH